MNLEVSKLNRIEQYVELKVSTSYNVLSSRDTYCRSTRFGLWCLAPLSTVYHGGHSVLTVF
jgi:hypothetical protein